MLDHYRPADLTAGGPRRRGFLAWVSRCAGALLAAIALLLLVFAGSLDGLSDLVPTATAQEPGDDSPATDAPATDTPETDGETTGPAASVKGRLVVDGEPVAGVRIVVELDGDEVGDATSDDDGTWEVAVPGPGLYTVTLDADSLPDDAFLANPDRQALGVEVRTNQNRTLVFALTSEEATGATAGGGVTAAQVVDRTIDGVRLGLIIALCSMGLSLIYGITRLVNFAEGELVTFGALVAFWLNAQGPRIQLLGAALIAIVISGLFGLALEKGIFAPLRRRKTSVVALMVVSIGLALFLRSVFLFIHGGSPRSFGDYAVQRAFDIGPATLPPKGWWAILVAGLTLAAVALLLQRTRLGTSLRAVADNRDLAKASGISVERVMSMTWTLGAALAGLGGILLALTEKVEPDLGFRLLLLIFVATILGGLGTAYGPIVGGVILGVVIQVSTLWFDIEFKNALALLVLVLMLLIRPQGILGKRERVG